MYKVLLIDDEPWVLKDLTTIIDWERLGFTVAACATDHVTAEQMLKKHAPELVICDIRMPDVTGMELMTKWKAEKPHLMFTFISAYGEFAYATEAIRLGAFDYLLKPVRPETLEAALEKAYARLEQTERQRLEWELLYNTQLFLELLDANRPHAWMAARLWNERAFRASGGHYQFVVAQSEEGATEGVNKLLLHAAEHIALGVMQAACLPARMGTTKWLCLLQYDEPGAALRTVAWRRLRKLTKAGQVSFGVSRPFSDLGQLKSHFREADILVRNSWVTGTAGVFVGGFRFGEAVGAWIEQVRIAPSSEALGEIIGRVADRRVKNKLTLTDLTHLYNESVRRKSRLDGWLKEDDAEESGTDDLAVAYSDADTMLRALSALVKRETRERSAAVANHSIIAYVIREIERNYRERLSLSAIADKHYINANYLSQLFKQETGKSFKQHLVETRLRKAAELLAQDELPLHEISSAVGYDDYFHFSKLFKKHMGTGPADYRRGS